MILVNSEYIEIIKAGIFSRQSNTYPLKSISNFRHLDVKNSIKHPLAGESFDYLGFQTEQQVIDDLHGTNRLAFDFENKTITFGDNIYSWQFEELSNLLYKISGQDFRIKEHY